MVSQVAELMPDQVCEAVYLAAALLPNGAIPISGMIDRMPVGGTGDQIPDFLDPPPFEIAWQSAFSGCDRATAEAAHGRLLAEPTGPLKAPMRLTADRFGRVPRTYIETLSDKAVPLALQRAMQEHLPCRRVFAIDSDHSPFLSANELLAETLCTIAGSAVSD